MLLPRAVNETMNALDAMTLWAPTLLLVTVRVAGMVAFAPVFGHSAVPVPVRVLVSVAMGLAVVSRLAGPVAVPDRALELIAAVGGEFLIGAAIGYAARMIFTGVELGAFHVSTQMGLSMADVIDPSRSDAPGATVGLYRMLAVVVFLAVGGHRALVGGLMGTFQSVPPLRLASVGGLLDMVVAMLAASFVLALKLAAPVLVAMLLATVALGLLHRTLPQLNLLSIGLPVRVLVGLVLVAASLAAVGPLVDVAVTQLGRNIQALTVVAR